MISDRVVSAALGGKTPDWTAAKQAGAEPYLALCKYVISRVRAAVGEEAYTDASLLAGSMPVQLAAADEAVCKANAGQKVLP
ncbi:hypothetical protein [Aliiruegeria sabulilitoris]|uniref:hypothetical protein n=1 Tax=Aliiruegeria sabulilitoris TaxID=1510458 RepID=UPI00082CF512|nr:hypothetical protein [Aliiruegeria sabulilitoris]NDR56611.1 hypothetical protein [Pseudoruegeria sp. M32A2M]